MNNEWKKRILIALSLCFVIIALIFIGLSIFDEGQRTLYLPIGLGATIVSNLLNVIRLKLD